ncbi:hypothetical protein LUZ60_014720 [Juncus effusus]|nr:hypothetical protein LUZ60_014720 [Juncus effusus]
MGEESPSPLLFLRRIDHHNHHHHHHHRFSSDLELDESEVFYSSSSPVDCPYSSPDQINHHYRLTPQRFGRFGLSSLLADSDDQSSHVTSPQPISCFKSSMERSGPHQSAPVAVPAWRGRSMEFNNWEEELDNGLDEEGGMVPPHVMVARSRAANAFSVLEGAGRTLKGRDLRRVRNAVWQKTGFLDL